MAQIKPILTKRFIDNGDEIFTNLKDEIKWKKSQSGQRNICSLYHYTCGFTQYNKHIENLINIFFEHFQRKIVGVFLNYYENGNDHVEYHSDTYKHDTALLSVGCTRMIRFKNNLSGKKIDYNLDCGDLLYFQDAVNENYRHTISKQNTNLGRISILFFFEPV